MNTIRGKVASNEILDVPNIGTRVFKRPGPRLLSGRTGEAVEPEKLARNLITVAVLEHAVVDGKRPAEVLCADCRAPVKVRARGPVPEKCITCTRPNLAGRVFGRLRVTDQRKTVERTGRSGRRRKIRKTTYYLCVCACPGRTEKWVSENMLLRGTTTGCGCVRREATARSNTDRPTHKLDDGTPVTVPDLVAASGLSARMVSKRFAQGWTAQQIHDGACSDRRKSEAHRERMRDLGRKGARARWKST